MSNDKTIIEVNNNCGCTVTVDPGTGAVFFVVNNPHVDKSAATVLLPAEARSLAAALVRHADTIDPPTFPTVDMCRECGDDTHLTFPSARPGAPDYGEYQCSTCRHVQHHADTIDPPGSVKLDADDIRRGAEAIAEAMGVPSEPMIGVTEDDKPEVAGWLVELNEVVHGIYAPWLGGIEAEDDARSSADSIGGTVRELHLGPVIYDASGPKQCEWNAYGPATGSRCWRLEHPEDTRHVHADPGGGLWCTPGNEPQTHAYQAAVRDRDEREGQDR